MTSFILVIVVSVLVSCLIGSAIGSTKGRGGAGFWLGLLGLPGWIIAAVMSPTTEVEARRAAAIVAAVNAGRQGGESESTRSCPFCAEEIKPAATVCRHCGRDVAPLSHREVTEVTEKAIETVRRKYPIESKVAWPYFKALSEEPECPAAWLNELCKRIHAGSPPTAAAARIPLNWLGPEPAPPTPEPILPTLGPAGPPDLAGNFPGLAKDYPNEYDVARLHMAGLAECPQSPEAWLRELCRRIEAGSPPSAAAARIPLDWTRRS